MEQLLDIGRARALLDGHFPVPVELDGQWWHLPVTTASGGGEAFVPAAEPLAAEFERLAARRRAAEAAVGRLAGQERT